VPRSSVSSDQFSVKSSKTMKKTAMSSEDAQAWSKIQKVQLNNQTRVLDETTHARVTNKLKDNKLITQYYDDVHTLYDGFMRGVRVSGDKPCLGYRPDATSPYKWLTYNEVKTRSTDFGAGLVNLCGLSCSPDQFLGIYAKNMVEWVVAEKGSMFYGMCLVPMYNTLGDQAMRWICEQTEMEIMVIENGQSLKDFKRDVLDHGEGKFIKKIILITPTDSDTNLIEEVQKTGVQVFGFQEVETYGKNHPLDHVPPKPDDTAVINYTSGTTGNPKGVMLTHRNFVADAAGAMYMLPRPFTGDDVWYSYLPLPHVFERTAQVCLMKVGACIGFFSGDIRAMPDDLKNLKPTIFGGVPRVWTRFYDKIKNAGAGSWIKGMLVNMALKSKIKEVEKGVCRNDSIWDKVVFKKVQALLGGRVTMAITGAAPISPEILNTLRAAFGAHMVEGYGQTECAAACSATLPGDHTGTVGCPLVCNEIRLDDVPDMKYFAKDGKGEICIRGDNVMKGYFKDDAKTKETIDDEGWLHTGDIGMWCEQGNLKIIDRKKNIFKLAQGEYIAPEKIENIYIRSSAAMQVFLHGDSLQAFLLVFAVPDPETFVSWCAENGFKGTHEELCKNEAVKKAVLADLVAIGKKDNLKSFEQAKAIHLDSDPWSVEKDLLTPTFKSKRPQLEKYYKTEIEQMYVELNKPK